MGGNLGLHETIDCRGDRTFLSFLFGVACCCPLFLFPLVVALLLLFIPAPCCCC